MDTAKDEAKRSAAEAHLAAVERTKAAMKARIDAKDPEDALYPPYEAAVADEHMKRIAHQRAVRERN